MLKSEFSQSDSLSEQTTVKQSFAERLIVFARFPESGKVKTRLIPALGADGAAKLHSALAERTLRTAQVLADIRPCEVEVQVAGGHPNDMRQLFDFDFSYVTQSGADLGARIQAAVHEAFEQNVERVLVVGTDCPDLSPERLKEALEALHHADVVLGPAVDGGYYLIGLQRNQPELFQGITWGTADVLQQTLEAARNLRLKVHQLSSLADVDYPEDLVHCRRAMDAISDVLPSSQPGLLSVIIPTLNEEQHIDAILNQLSGMAEVEVLIADGGSQDKTVQIAQQHKVRVVPTLPGRGRQMNAGAALASGEFLLFLHADLQLPSDFLQQIRETLSKESAGAFRLRINGPRRGLRAVEWGTNLRSHYCQLPYGDQGIFLRSRLFYQLGGFSIVPLMEDFEFCRRLKHHAKIRIVPSAITTSSRRWDQLGILRTTLINQLCVAGYLLGVKPERLAKWYAGRNKNSAG